MAIDVVVRPAICAVDSLVEVERVEQSVATAR